MPSHPIYSARLYHAMPCSTMLSSHLKTTKERRKEREEKRKREKEEKKKRKKKVRYSLFVLTCL
jgi:hypothetical protein